MIKTCNDWYANRIIKDFHQRKTVQDFPYELRRLNFAKRCCSDDANLCEVVEINGGKNDEQHKYVQQVLKDNSFNTMYRRQLEQTSANGTVACYIRLDQVRFLSNGRTEGGRLRLNYVDADCFIPLTVENGTVTEAAFSGSSLVKGKKQTVLVMFTLDEGDRYVSETHVFDEYGTELKEQEVTVQLGNVKPFAVMRTAEVNNLDGMDGYGLPKLWNSIPFLEALDLCYNILFGDLDKGEKLVLINELLCKFDQNGRPITPCEQAKKTFVMMGEKLPGEKEIYHEYNPEIRIEQVTKIFELLLSLLSMSFGYGTKKYGFENGRITTATEYIGERQDQMQELNRQRYEAEQYIRDIVKAVLWFSNTFLQGKWDIEEEITISFDDSYVTDREAELERKRNDALSFDIPKLTVWYLMEAYGLSEKEAEALLLQKQEPEDEDETED